MTTSSDSRSNLGNMKVLMVKDQTAVVSVVSNRSVSRNDIGINAKVSLSADL